MRDILEKDATISSLIFSNSNKKDDLKSATEKNKNDFIQQVSELEGRINLRIGKIGLPDFQGRDILIDGRLKSGNFTLKSFKMTADDGVAIKGKGVITNLNNDSQGNVRFSVVADSSKGLRKIAKQLNAPKDFLQNDRLLSDLTPLRLAVTMNMYSGGLPSTDISIAGAVSRSQLSINARHEGTIGTFGSKQLDVSGTLINPQAKDLIAQLVRTKHTIDINEIGQGTFSIQATGVPESTMETRAILDAGTTQASFNGRINLVSGSSSGRGKLKIKSSNSAAGLSLIGISQTLDFVDKPMELSANINKSKNIYKISDLNGQIGSIRLNANGEFDVSSEPVRMKINSQITEASLSGILSYFIPSVLPSGIERVAKIAGAQAEQPWSNRPFDIDGFKNMDGSISVKFNVLKIAENLELNNGILHANLNNNAIQLSKMTGQMYNGQFSATAKLFSEAGQFKLSSALSLRGADLAEIFKARDGRSLARGSFTTSMAFSGGGLSPLGLIAELKGKGKFRIKEGEIFDFSNEALPKIISTSSGKENDKALKESFFNYLSGSSFRLKQINSPVAIRNGVIRLENISFNSGATRAKTSTFIELASMKLDSEWSLEANRRSKNALPGVRMIFSGPVGDMASIKPELDISELKQSLVVKKIEQDFDTLKKLDERDPETIRRLQNSPQSYNNPGNRKKAPVALRTPDNRQNSLQQNELPGYQNRAEENKDINNDQLPSLTNLGTIDQREIETNNTGDQLETRQSFGTEYQYDTQGLNGRDQERLGEEEKEPAEQKVIKPKKETPSLLDGIFGNLFNDG